uniref:Regulator of G protein signaling 22 n=1 Tax=Corvus moneduloides TaxID=1196302 RepID=A0A8C3GU19_CORMO
LPQMHLTFKRSVSLLIFSSLDFALLQYHKLSKLLLQTFAQPVKFNSDVGAFEVVNYPPRCLERQPKKILHDQKPPSPIYDVLRKAENDGQLSKMHSASPTFGIDPNYNTMQLNQEQAIQWIKKERLPAFLESDCYFEYRLAKLISQVEWSKSGINFVIDSDYSPWIWKQRPISPPPEEDDTSLTMKKFYTKKQVTCLRNATNKSFLSPSGTASAKADVTCERSREAEEGYSVAIAEPASHTQLRVYLNPKWGSAAKEENEQGSTTFQAPEKFIPASAQILANNEFSHGTAESFFNQSSSPLTALDSKEDVRKQDPEQVSLSSSSESGGPDSRAAWCISHGTYDTGNRHEFERFKKFIKGTLGEKYWWLWMDIERLKALKNATRQQRQLSKMKKLYLLSSGDYFLSSEVLLRLELLHGDQWNIMHLRRIQPEVVKPLLLYWGPRFCVTHSTAVDAASAKLKFWHTCQERPRVDIDPFPQIVSLLPLTQKSGTPPSLLQVTKPNFSLKSSSRLPPTLTGTQILQRDDISSNRIHLKIMKACYSLLYNYVLFVQGESAAGSVVFGGSGIESMLQSLYLENRAGYYFTKFCEKSGNKLWKNSVYFWFDLQAYHQLFYQETLQHFQICKQAQFLYATYIAPSASMDIELHQNKKNMIYQKIDPAFEDLFDPAEEHILTILLEPWMKMVEADKYTYRKVELVEETQQLDSVYFRKFQALHQVSSSKKDESTVADIGALKEDQHLHQVPKELAGPNLSDLIHNKEKLEQFWAFLNEHSARYVSSLLLFYLKKSNEKSKDIKNKYLNNRYFFGPNSPATREQQEKVLMHSGGGRRQSLHDQLSAAVLLEVQQCVQKRLEKQWLPLFLADEHHGAEGQIRDITEDLSRKDQQKTTGMWKHVDNKSVSSSSEIIAFRKALLDPVTGNLFQRFVSLKGDLLGNGVLFWQEVQKYKDLCHSHCADAIVQKKITAIIDCFINSAIPPALQIDIPPEQAKKIVERRKELGPYIFREAQMSIFALLFKFWPEFCKFQSNTDRDKILVALEKKKEGKMQKKEGITAKVRLIMFQVTASWSYSKYIEALEQERIYVKRQEDLEKPSLSFSAGY